MSEPAVADGIPMARSVRKHDVIPPVCEISLKTAKPRSYPTNPQTIGDRRSRGRAGDDEGFVAEPEAAVFVEHRLGRP